MKLVKVTKAGASIQLSMRELLVLSGALGVSVVQHELNGKPHVDGYAEELRLMKRIDKIISEIGLRKAAKK